jgi:hypothetical protein
MPRPDDDYDSDRPGRRDRDEGDFDSRRRRDDEYDRPPPRRKSSSKPLFIILGVVVFLVLACGGAGIYGLIAMRESADRLKSRNNLMQIGLAIHNFNDTANGLPANTYDATGKPLLSWRVHILPYVEQDNLYKQFKLDEPWDGPNNRLLLDRMPRIYARPGAPDSTRLTHYRGFSSPGAVFSAKVTEVRGIPAVGRLSLGDIGTKDGLASTVMVVEAADPIEWTKPDDLDASPGKPFPVLGGEWSGKKVNLLLGDGSIRNVRRDIPEDILRSLVTVDGKDPLPPGWDAN